MEAIEEFSVEDKAKDLGSIALQNRAISHVMSHFINPFTIPQLCENFNLNRPPDPLHTQSHMSEYNRAILEAFVRERRAAMVLRSRTV